MANKIEDLKGKRFGKLLVIERDYGKSLKRPFWKCQCECGNFTIVSSAHLKKGDTKSCGCLKTHKLEGQKFGRWLVIERYKNKNSKYNGFWKCQCECGNQSFVNSYNLLSGKSASCGCYQKEITIKRLTTHNMTDTRIYRIYNNIKMRCYNNKAKRYFDYGGRGIKVCEEWLGENGFINFYNWSMTNGYRDDLTIDRIDNDGNYEPSNCRWVGIEQQSNNKRLTIFFEFLGVKKSLKQWTNFMNWDYRKYYGRYSRGYTTFREEDIKLIKEKLKGEIKNE